MRRRSRWLALALGLGLAAAALVLSLGVPTPGLAEALAREAKSRLGVELTHGRVRFAPFEGLVLEDMEAVATSGGRRYRLASPRVVFQNRPRALLEGVVDVRAIRFERPRLELVELEEGPAASEPREGGEAEGLFRLTFGLEEVVLENAVVGLGDEASELTATLEDVDLRFDEIGLRAGATGPLAVEGAGKLTARSARLGALALSEAQADVYVHEGQISLTLLHFRSDRVPFVAEMRVDLSRSPFGYEVSARGEPFDAAALVGAPTGSFGEASLLIEVFGRGPAPAGFRAQGSLTLPEGALSDWPLLTAIDAALGGDVFHSADTRRESILVYRVRDGYVLFEPFELASPRATASFRGRAYLDGRLDLEVEVGAPDGSVRRLSVSGTVDAPSVRRLGAT